MESFSNRIIINEEICNGQPTIKNTRIAVHTILDFMASGDSIEEILYQYPDLKIEDIFASLAFASKITSAKFSIKDLVA